MDISTTTYSFTLGYPGKKDKGNMYHSSHFFNEDTIIESLPPNGFLGLYFNLNNEMKCEIKGEPLYSMGRNQYNMVYLPMESCELTFQKGSYASFYIECSVAYLNLIVDKFPILQTFMAKADRMVPTRMNEEHLTIPPHITDKINTVVNNGLNPQVREIFLKAKFVDILLSCFEHSQQHRFSGLDKDEIEKIKTVHAVIVKNIQAQHAVNQLADELELDQRKLEKGFKVMFGTTVYQFIINKRMEKATHLLRDTMLPVSKIAASVGYPTARIFTDIFTKKYGCPPTAFRNVDL